MFAYAARDHSKHHGTTIDQFAKVTYKNRRHGAMNTRACLQVHEFSYELMYVVWDFILKVCKCIFYCDFCFQSPVTLDFIKTKRELCYPITFPMSAPTADGGAAAIVCSEEFVSKHNLQV